MPTEHVLLAIESAFGAAGFDKAQLAMLGLSGSAIALGAVLGGVVLVSKDMIEIAAKHEEAEKSLSQAYQATGTDLSKYRGEIERFLIVNREFTADQSEVLSGFATLTRAGLSQTEVMRVMNDAVALSALKHISLSEAVTLLNAAEHGRMRGLIDLGVTTAKYTDANGNLIQSQHSVAQSMAEVEAAIRKGKDAKTDDEKATNALGNDWQTFARGPGAELGRAFTNAKQIGDLFLQMLFAMGHNNPLWDAIQNKLIGLAKWVHDYIIKPWQDVIAWFGKLPSPTSLPAAGPAGRYGRQSGGPVYPGGVYTVGESRAETLSMFPGGGGYVTSNAPSRSSSNGSSSIYIDLRGAFVPDGPSIDRLANLILQRARHAPGM